MALVVASVITGSAAFVANVVETQKFNDIKTVTIPDNVLAPPPKPGAPANYLIIGSDSRAFVDTPEQAKAFGDRTRVVWESEIPAA